MSIKLPSMNCSTDTQGEDIGDYNALTGGWSFDIPVDEFQDGEPHRIVLITKAP